MVAVFLRVRYNEKKSMEVVELNKQELLELRKYVGDLDTVLGICDCTYNEGKAKGVRALQIKNGSGLELTVLPDRAMDIPYLSYKGTNIGFNSKTGVTAPQFFTESGGRGFLKSFYAGFLTTCGITYAGAAGEYKGEQRGLHGEISNIPADMVSKQLVEENGELKLRVAGRMKQACIFDEHVVMEREIVVDTAGNSICVNDVITNMGFEPCQTMNLYHVNFGYPMLDEGARTYFSAANMQPRDDIAKAGADAYNVMEKPQEGYQEQCFFFTDDAPQKDSFAMLVHKDGNLAVVVHYDQTQCPLLTEWKCMMAGDYALGLEPTTAGVMGNAAAEKSGMMRFIAPGEEYRYQFKIDILDDTAEIQKYIDIAKM